ncbi:MAG TPA: nitroreductase family protein [Actinoplanes sp.]|jgi:nitroreductase
MPELHPSLAGRWSPRAFETRHDIGRADLVALLEAARWAPSAGNAQPWRFVIGRRDDEAHKHIFACLGREEQRWAWRASALIVAAYTTSGDIPAVRAAYDLGQAIAHLGVQASALNLHIHQMSGFDSDQLHDELRLPDDVVPQTVVAVGRLGDPTTLPEDLRLREFRLRERRRVQDLLLASLL